MKSQTIISAKTFRKQFAGRGNVSKYKAIKTTIDGITFHSAKEARRYSELVLMQKAGEIRSLELQPIFKFTIDGRPVLIKSTGFPNGRHASYRGDFRYFDTRKKAIVIEDCKGFRTDVYKIKKALVECMWPGTTIVEV